MVEHAFHWGLRGAQAARFDAHQDQIAIHQLPSAAIGFVAQSSTLPYRRVALGCALDVLNASTRSQASQSATLRYCRVKLCVTFTFTLSPSPAPPGCLLRTAASLLAAVAPPH